MSDSTRLLAGSGLRPKTVLFLGIGLMTAYVLYHNERFLIEPSNPVWEHYAEVAWWLIPHSVAGACALLLAPLQFSDRLRQRHARMHRVVGRIYVVGALVLAPLGAALQYVNEGLGQPRDFTVLAIVDATMLMTTTSIAFLFALRRRITQHRQWMTRSYAVALVFFEGRMVGGLMGLDNSISSTMTAIWTCLALSMLFAELANSYQDLGAAMQSPAVQAPVRRPPSAAPALQAPAVQ